MGEISQNIQEKLVIVRGGGDLATGVIQKLWHVGFKILVLETECPLAIRRTVSVCDAIFQKEQRVGCCSNYFIKGLREMLAAK